MSAWIWMCFTKGTLAGLYKHRPNLQEATRVMTNPPPDCVGTTCYYPQTPFPSANQWIMNTTDIQY